MGAMSLGAIGGGATAVPVLGLIEVGLTLASLFSNPKPPGVDIRPTTSQYGLDIPQFWGNVTLPTQLIWSMGVHDNGNSTSKKGGEENYSGTFLVSLGESRPGATLGRVWYDDGLIIDNISGSSSAGTPTETQLCDYFGFSTTIYASFTASQLAAWQQEYKDQHNGSNPTVDPSNVKLYVGGPTQEPDPMWSALTYNITTSAPEGSSGTGTPAYRHLTTLQIDNIWLGPWGNAIPTVKVELVETGVTLADVVTDLCLREGFTSDQIDVSAVTGISVRGLVRKSATDFDQFLQTVLSMYQCDLVQVDNVIRVVPRGGAPVATIPLADVGCSSETGGEPKQPYTLTVTDEKEIPYAVYLDFPDAWNLNQTATQFAQRTDTVSLVKNKISVDLTATDTEAQTYCTQILYAAWQDRYKYDFDIGSKYAWLCPTDVLTLWNGDRVRITEIGVGTFAELKIKAVRDGGGVPSLTGTTGGSAATDPVQATALSTQFAAWSGTELDDLDGVSPGFYVAATGANSGLNAWGGCAVFYSPDSGTSWISAGKITTPSVIGIAMTALNTTMTEAPTFDNTSVVTIATFAGGLLGSTTAAEVLAGGNEALIGSELVGFETATATTGAPNYQYSLATFQRGLRGTASSGHVIGEQFVLVSSPGPLRVKVPSSLVGETVLVKCVGQYSTLTDVTAVSVVITPNNVPYATGTTVSTAVTAAIDALAKPTFYRVKGYLNPNSTENIDATYFDTGANFPSGATQHKWTWYAAGPGGSFVYETPGMQYRLWLRIGINNTTAAAVAFNWWVPAFDNSLRVQLNGSNLYVSSGATFDQSGTASAPANSTSYLDLFWTNDNDGDGAYNPTNQGVLSFITNMFEQVGLTFVDSGP